MTVAAAEPQGTATLSGQLASEVRAEMARQRVSNRELAKRMGVSHVWVARRVTAQATDMTLDELAMVAKALGKPVPYFLKKLPWFDSNEQPFG